MSRFRVFAGPNGSGKSTIISAVQNFAVKDKQLDLGVYVNADAMAVLLNEDQFDFTAYKLPDTTVDMLVAYDIKSGLFRNGLTEELLRKIITITGAKLILHDKAAKEVVAQLASNYTVDALIAKGEQCSMETVFSHISKVEMMRNARNRGYKVYLYFVSTEDPDINKHRVAARVKKGGHNVPEQTIEERYYRSLGLLFDATKEAHSSFFFDNSSDGCDGVLVASWITDKDKQVWEGCGPEDAPAWLRKYYFKKINDN